MVRLQILKSTKTLLAIFALTMFSFSNMKAQRIAVCDINTVLESLDDYKQAQTELDKLASQWRQDIAQEYDKIKGMYNAYQAEQVLMSEEMRKDKEDEIMNAEKRVRELQKNKFGPEGALFKKRQDLVRPIQEKVYNAIEDFAAQKGYDFIFDAATSTGIIFANPKYDKTDDIKRELGL